MNYSEVEDLFGVLNDLRQLLYELPDGRVGGPLHVVLDDFNFEDSSLALCEKWTEERPVAPAMEVLAKALLQGLHKLTHAQRFIWNFHYNYKDPAQEALDKADWRVVFDDAVGVDHLEPPPEL